MAGVYLTGVVLDDPFPGVVRPDVPAGTQYATMFVDRVVNGACITSPSNTITHPGVTLLVSGTTWSDLRAQGRAQNVTGGARNQVNDWCASKGLLPLPSGTISWADAILFVCRQVNPSASFDLTYLGPPD